MRSVLGSAFGGLLAAGGLLVLLFGPGQALAYSYGPENEAEWIGWPEYCKVRYTVSDGGRGSIYVNTRGPGDVAMWRDRFGDCWGHMHHHCASLLQLQRAKLALTPQARKFALESAIGEETTALSVCPASHPFHSEMRTQFGLIYMEMRNFAKADEFFDSAIVAHPDSASPYIAKSQGLKKRGEPEAALKVLQQGSEATNQGSAELENALGLAYFDRKDFEAARKHARNAYSLGYPLPALRDKLAKAGFPL